MLPIIRRAFSTFPAYERFRYLRKIQQLKKEHPSGFSERLDPRVEREIIQYWASYGIKVRLNWHRGYASVCGGENVFRYIPEDIYYAYIERSFNRYELADAYADKNEYSRLFPNVRAPATILRRMNGRFYDSDYKCISSLHANELVSAIRGDLIIKPSIDSGDGKNVRKLMIENGQFTTDNEPIDMNGLISLYGRDFIIQHVFKQHPAIAEFHPNSVNTIRFYTLRWHDEIKIISAVLRLGNMGRHFDNRGIPCGINADGRLNDYANTKYFQRHDVHPVTGKAFKGFVLPGWQAAREFVKGLHQGLRYFDSASWDITIDPDSNPCLMEVNLTFQEINFHQVNNGPLFGDLTDEILSHVFPKKSVSSSR
jgi:Sugar-transfer associated ATP-grasp